MKHKWKRLIALFLALTMVMSLLCGNAWAEEITEPPVTEQECSDHNVDVFDEQENLDTKETSIIEATEEQNDLKSDIESENQTEILEAVPSDIEEPAEQESECESINESDADKNNVLDDEIVVSVPVETPSDSSETLRTQDITSGYWTYSLGSSVYTAKVTGYSGYSSSVSIPNTVTYNGITYRVTELAENLFKNNTTIRSITLPQNLAVIGNNAFYNCSNLSSITINSTHLNNLPYYSKAFYNAGINTRGINVTFGSGVTRIPSYLFSVYDTSYNSGNGTYARISSICISDSITEIGSYAFRNCYNLSTIYMGSKVKTIGESAFENCYPLSSITIPETTTSIGNNAFYNCSNLSSITIKATNLSDFPYYNKAFYNAGINNNSLDVVFSPGVTEIPDYMFRVYDSSQDYGNGTYAHITSVTIPDTVTCIGDYAFSNCYDLTNITVGKGIKTIGECAFQYCSFSQFTIPESTYQIGNDAFYFCSELKKLTINAKNLNDFAYYNKCFYKAGSFSGGLTATFGASVRRIPNYMFRVYDSSYDYGNGAYAHITSVSIPDSVTTIGNYAFCGCYDLKTCKIGNKTTYIGEGAFECCPFSSFTIPSTVSTIGQYAFYNCTNLSSLTINASSLPDFSYYNKAFYNIGANSNKLSVIFGSTVTRIPKYMFRVYDTSYNYGNGYYAHITEVSIPSSVKEICAYSFDECYDMKLFTIKNQSAVFNDERFSGANSALTFKCFRGSTAAAFANKNSYKISYLPSPPAAPSISAVTNTTTGTKVSWKKVSGAQGYYVYRKTNSGSYSKVKNTTSTSWTDTGAKTNGAKYTYKVYAYNTSGNSPASKAVVSYFVSTPALSSAANVKGAKMTVKWKKNSSATGYQVQYSTDKAFKKSVKSVTIKKNSTVSTTISKLTKKKTYYVRIRAYKTASGKNYYSGWSAVKSAAIKK